MPENSENPDWELQVDGPPPSLEEFVKVDAESAFLVLPKHSTSFSAAAQAILEELRIRQRRYEMHGSSEITPSLFLTLDQVPGVLHKEVHLPETHKTEKSISEAISELSNKKEGFKNRYVYLYPFFLQLENRISVRIAIIAPQNQEKTDIVPYRRSCFRYSTDLLNILLKNRATKAPLLEELHPGRFLISEVVKGNVTYSPLKFSYEFEIDSIIKKGFEPYDPVPVPDFIQDAVSYGKDTGKLWQVTNDYHIIVPGASFVSELERHIAVQLDAICIFAFQFLKQIAKENNFHLFLDQAETLESKVPQKLSALLSEGWKFTDSVSAMIGHFPFDRLNLPEAKVWAESSLKGIEILAKLSAALKKNGKNELDAVVVDYLSSVEIRIRENTSKTLTMTEINLDTEVAAFTKLSVDEKKEAKERIRSALIARFGVFEEIRDANQKILFVLDQRYFSEVFNHLQDLQKADSSLSKDIYRLEEMKKSLLERKDDQLDLLSSKKEAKQNETAPSDAKQTAKLDLDAIHSRFNIPAGAIGFLSGSVLSFVLAISLNQIQLLLIGFVLSLGVGAALAYFLRKDAFSKSEKAGGKRKNAEREESFLSFIKASENLIYPKKFNDILEKVYDSKRLRYKIEEELENIKSLLPLKDRKKEDEKMISEVEYALLQISVVIRVPNSIQVRNRPKELIVSKADFKTPLCREKLAENYRKEANLYKSDREVMEYINYMIKEIEFGYSKYLK
ncbi:hypothetical protein [Leptospira idonii]|uniref:Uncharacterized protein n=1 Tax=Leptospira idonii TaxID=1193500 RepID=A0A4R9M1X9_9LEPT|nr:hypothetical protein [Leptospira idonii]TGN18758.1 hypothetical protein EHS15_15425 [Leptospira idonii]